MKTFFRVLVLGLFMVVMTAATSTVTFAQTDEKTTLYNEYLETYQGTIEQRKKAVVAAKKYIEKYGSSADDAEIVKYFRDSLPALEKGIKDEIAANKAAEKERKKQARYAKFDTAVKAKNWDATYQSGGEILAAEPNLVDVILVLGSIGLDESAKQPPVTKFNNATIKYAKMAISKMNSGVKAKNYGAYSYSYGNKNKAMGWMNYTIGMIMYYSQGKNNPAVKNAALPYLYKSTQINSDRKKEPRTYSAIGDWYFNEAGNRVTKRNAIFARSKELIKTRNETDDKAEQEKLDAEIDMLEKQVLESVTYEKAYADRALDAYGRAYQLAKANPKEPQAYKDGLLKTINDLYNFRFLKPAEKTPAKVNMFLSGLKNKPMPNPSTPITPVTEGTTADSVSGRARKVSNGNR